MPLPSAGCRRCEIMPPKKKGGGKAKKAKAEAKDGAQDAHKLDGAGLTSCAQMGQIWQCCWGITRGHAGGRGNGPAARTIVATPNALSGAGRWASGLIPSCCGSWAMKRTNRTLRYRCGHPHSEPAPLTVCSCVRLAVHWGPGLGSGRHEGHRGGGADIRCLPACPRARLLVVGAPLLALTCGTLGAQS